VFFFLSFFFFFFCFYFFFLSFSFFFCFFFFFFFFFLRAVATGAASPLFGVPTTDSLRAVAVRIPIGLTTACEAMNGCQHASPAHTVPRLSKIAVPVAGHSSVFDRHYRGPRGMRTSRRGLILLTHELPAPDGDYRSRRLSRWPWPAASDARLSESTQALGTDRLSLDDWARIWCVEPATSGRARPGVGVLFTSQGDITAIVGFHGELEFPCR